MCIVFRPLCLVVLLCIAAPPALHAQDSDTLNRIALAVVTPESYAGLNAGQLSSLRNKVIRMVTANGLSSDGFRADLVIYPLLDIQDRRVVKGLRDLTIVQGELSLYVKNVKQDLIFASVSLPILGNGTSDSQAITSALRNIKSANPPLENFFDTAKQRIAHYYDAECDNMLGRARTLATIQLFDQALDTVMRIPLAASACYTRAQETAVDIFEAYQTQSCGEQVQAARAAISNDKFEKALYLLGNINPASSCHAESVRLMGGIAGELGALQKGYYNTIQQAYLTVHKEKTKPAKAVSAIYLAYCQSQSLSLKFSEVSQ